MAVLLWALLAAATPTAAPPPAAPAKLAPAAKISLPRDRAHPLLSNPQLDLAAKTLYLVRAAAARSTNRGLDVVLMPLGPSAAAGQSLSLPAPAAGPDTRIFLTPNERTLVVLSGGELWLKPLMTKEGESADPRRLYPPSEGDAPLGPSLSHVALSPDSSWALVQSPTGWGRIALQNGAFAPLSVRPIDLSGGSVALGPDGVHVLFAKAQASDGSANVLGVIAVNIETNFAQILDKEHRYDEVLFLPDGKPVGRDPEGALWMLSGGGRKPYYAPPKLPAGVVVSRYAVSLGLQSLAFVGRSHGEDAVWVAGAPRPPKSGPSKD